MIMGMKMKGAGKTSVFLSHQLIVILKYTDRSIRTREGEAHPPLNLLPIYDLADL